MCVIWFACNYIGRYEYDSVGGSGCCFVFFLLSLGGKIFLVSGILSCGQALSDIMNKSVIVVTAR